MTDHDEKMGGGLIAGIAFAPLIFGWVAMRPRYPLAVRIMVALYMILTSIPLYFLTATLWTSGDDIKRMAREFDRNRAVQQSSTGTADKYLDAYEKGDLSVENATDGSGSTTDNAGGPIRMTALEAARAQELHKLPNDGMRPVDISGRASATPNGTTLYLDGNDTYPAVTLEYARDAPTELEKGDEVTAMCDTIKSGTAGPILQNCR